MSARTSILATEVTNLGARKGLMCKKKHCCHPHTSTHTKCKSTKKLKQKCTWHTA